MEIILCFLGLLFIILVISRKAPPKYYIKLTSGPNAGEIYAITKIDRDVLTVDKPFPPGNVEVELHGIPLVARVRSIARLHPLEGLEVSK